MYIFAPLCNDNLPLITIAAIWFIALMPPSYLFLQEIASEIRFKSSTSAFTSILRGFPTSNFMTELQR